MQLLHDGAPTHRARAPTAYLNAINVNVVNLLPKSPDLNIIEIIWDELNRSVMKTGAIPTTLNQLSKNSLREEPSPSELRSAFSDINEMPSSCLGDIPATKFTWT